VLALRLLTLQILAGGYYQAKAEGNRLRMVTMTAARGIMYDRNGQILVGSRPAYTISIMPTGKALDEGEVAKLAALLKMKPEDITKKVNDHKYGYEPIRIANDISMDVVTTIEEHRHELPGVTIDVEPLRYYPYETMASQLFGYVGEVSEEELEELKQKDPNTLVSGGTILGRSGLEKLYDSILRGTDGGKQVEVDATYKPVKFLELQGMFSYGDYRYKGNATGADFDESNVPVATTAGSTTLYLDQVKVGGSGNSSIPQLTASLGATIKPINDLSIYGTWRFVGNLYSAVNTNDYKTVARQEQGALRLPDYNLLDLGISYKLRLRERSQYFTFGANVYNVIDTYYISDASTSIHATAGSTTYKGVDTNNKVFFGAGRTWAASVAFNF